MIPNIRALVAACDTLGLTWTVQHPSQNIVAVEINGHPHLFVNWATAINTQAFSRLCKDKAYTYDLLEGVVPMPRTLSFLDPFVREEYQHHVAHKTFAQIADAAEELGPYPLIVKKNRGSGGDGIFLMHDREALLEAIARGFDRTQAVYDYVLLVQQHLRIAREYRAVFLDGKLSFAYHKDTQGARFDGNISPLHWDGARAVLVEDPEVCAHMEALMRPAFARLPIRHTGVDLAVDEDGAWWLIEVNAAPSFEIFTAHCGMAQPIAHYRAMLLALGAQEPG